MTSWWLSWQMKGLTFMIAGPIVAMLSSDAAFMGGLLFGIGLIFFLENKK